MIKSETVSNYPGGMGSGAPPSTGPSLSSSNVVMNVKKPISQPSNQTSLSNRMTVASTPPMKRDGGPGVGIISTIDLESMKMVGKDWITEGEDWIVMYNPDVGTRTGLNNPRVHVGLVHSLDHGR